jgi:hypothetical protein
VQMREALHATQEEKAALSARVAELSAEAER